MIEERLRNHTLAACQTDASLHLVAWRGVTMECLGTATVEEIARS